MAPIIEQIMAQKLKSLLENSESWIKSTRETYDYQLNLKRRI